MTTEIRDKEHNSGLAFGWSSSLFCALVSPFSSSSHRIASARRAVFAVHEKEEPTNIDSRCKRKGKTSFRAASVWPRSPCFFSPFSLLSLYGGATHVSTNGSAARPGPTLLYVEEKRAKKETRKALAYLYLLTYATWAREIICIRQLKLS